MPKCLFCKVETADSDGDVCGDCSFKQMGDAYVVGLLSPFGCRLYEAEAAKRRRQARAGPAAHQGADQ